MCAARADEIKVLKEADVKCVPQLVVRLGQETIDQIQHLLILRPTGGGASRCVISVEPANLTTEYNS